MIQINDNWRVRTDAYNFIPERFYAGGEAVRVIKTGEMTETKDRWKSIDQYYPTLQSALNGIAKWEMLNLGQQDLSLGQYLEQLDAVLSRLKLPELTNTQ